MASSIGRLVEQAELLGPSRRSCAALAAESRGEVRRRFASFSTFTSGRRGTITPPRQPQVRGDPIRWPPDQPHRARPGRRPRRPPRQGEWCRRGHRRRCRGHRPWRCPRCRCRRGRRSQPLPKNTRSPGTSVIERDVGLVVPLVVRHPGHDHPGQSIGPDDQPGAVEPALGRRAAVDVGGADLRLGVGDGGRLHTARAPPHPARCSWPRWPAPARRSRPTRPGTPLRGCRSCRPPAPGSGCRRPRASTGSAPRQ